MNKAKGLSTHEKIAKRKIAVFNSQGELKGYVSQSVTSVGASKIADCPVCFSFRNPRTGEHIPSGAWVAKTPPPSAHELNALRSDFRHGFFG